MKKGQGDVLDRLENKELKSREKHNLYGSGSDVDGDDLSIENAV